MSSRIGENWGEGGPGCLAVCIRKQSKGSHRVPTADKCIRLPLPLWPLVLLPPFMILQLIALSRFVPWKTLRGGHGCGYGDGGGCTQLGELAVRTYGTRAGLGYIGAII